MALRFTLLSRNLLRNRYCGDIWRPSTQLGWRRHLATVSTAVARTSESQLSPQIEQATSRNNSNSTTLPASWYRSDKLCELEKRAIYSNSWFMTTHTAAFTKPGDYRVFDLAGQSIFLVMGHDGEIRGFHNVCRHRAYPLRTQPAGCSSVISCGYHAWTWNLEGGLIRAPQFKDVPNFNKSDQSLWSVHVHITRGGCIFVNLEASEVPSMSFQQFFPGLEELLDDVDFARFKLLVLYPLRSPLSLTTRIDGFQECYHCQVAHPSLAKSFDINNYSLMNHPTYTQHVAIPSSNAKDAYGNSNALFLYLYPSSAINCFETGWQTSFTSPIDARTCRVSMEYWVDKSLSEQEKEDFVKSFYQVFKEDCDLCEKVQKNVDAGVYSKGVLHPTHESGVLAYQARTRELVLQHAALEESVGHEINPSNRVDQSTGVMDRPEDRLCARLEHREWRLGNKV
ncbi:ISP domain-containing protein [Dacryopinax primogenitus]|uniref:Choline monooxygenase, chloroplastic n=1 Tax=Dacryopinax primogenitus (strain DJM 731) TaxID=1858805 RepID=M5G4I6_DACPD|nr:ISP domain-containing protein [Dacryopinax primogenitus]EJU00742.1 ISP domain-containing protein [Dacryopinax primogenitus]